MVVHAANNAFSKWEEYNTMIGLGGWGAEVISQVLIFILMKEVN